MMDDLNADVGNGRVENIISGYSLSLKTERGGRHIEFGQVKELKCNLTVHTLRDRPRATRPTRSHLKSLNPNNLNTRDDINVYQ